MVKPSQSVREFIVEGVMNDQRVDGRGLSDIRPFSVQLGFVPHASGSARLKRFKTDILVVVMLELGPPRANEDLGQVEVTVECSPSASPAFAGRGARSLNTELAGFLQEALIHPTVLDLPSLCIVPGQQCWIVHVDAIVLDAEGSLLDYLFLAANAALRDSRVPKISVLKDEASGIAEVDVDDDLDAGTPLSSLELPVAITFSVIGGRYVIDASEEEEFCSDCAVTIAFCPSSQSVVALRKSGSSGLPVDRLKEVLGMTPVFAAKRSEMVTLALGAK